MIKPAAPDATTDIGFISIPIAWSITLGDGQAGARPAPTAVRKALKKYGPTFNIEHYIYFVGLSDAAKLLDIVEINPEYDMDSQTTRPGASVMICFFNRYKIRRSAR